MRTQSRSNAHAYISSGNSRRGQCPGQCPRQCHPSHLIVGVMCFRFISVRAFDVNTINLNWTKYYEYPLHSPPPNIITSYPLATISLCSIYLHISILSYPNTTHFINTLAQQNFIEGHTFNFPQIISSSTSTSSSS